MIVLIEKERWRAYVGFTLAKFLHNVLTKCEADCFKCGKFHCIFVLQFKISLTTKKRDHHAAVIDAVTMTMKTWLLTIKNVVAPHCLVAPVGPTIKAEINWAALLDLHKNMRICPAAMLLLQYNWIISRNNFWRVHLLQFKGKYYA